MNVKLNDNNVIKIKCEDSNCGRLVSPHDYELSGAKKYSMDIRNEALPWTMHVFMTMSIMGEPLAMKDYDDFCKQNNFEVPTNAFVAEFYGNKPLWKTRYSQGIVVKNSDISDQDYYVLIECSRENTGYKYTKFLLTPGGCE